jgi:hypothetical protein
MKQLILYFLFFVGFALILIQCAWLFPSTNTLPSSPSRIKAKTKNYNAVNNQPGAGLSLSHAVNYDFGSKNSLLLPVFYDSFAPRQVVSKLHTRRRFYDNSYLKHYSFANNYDGKLQQEKKY